VPQRVPEPPLGAFELLLHAADFLGQVLPHGGTVRFQQADAQDMGEVDLERFF
jgi:hypothetical protein